MRHFHTISSIHLVDGILVDSEHVVSSEHFVGIPFLTFDFSCLDAVDFPAALRLPGTVDRFATDVDVRADCISRVSDAPTASFA